MRAEIVIKIMEISQAIKLGDELLEKYNLEGWIIKSDNARVRFGQCRRWQKTISISKTLVELNSEEKVRETILHEIAHALITARGHGVEWKTMAMRVGIKPQRAYSEANTITPKATFIYVCQKCDYELGRFQKISYARLQRISHSECGGRFKNK